MADAYRSISVTFTKLNIFVKGSLLGAHTGHAYYLIAPKIAIEAGPRGIEWMVDKITSISAPPPTMPYYGSMVMSVIGFMVVFVRMDHAVFA